MPIHPAGILFLSNTLGFVLFALIAVAWILGLVDIVVKRSDLTRGQRAAWILFIVLLPLIGTFAYFIRRPTLEDEREKIIASRTGRGY